MWTITCEPNKTEQTELYTIFIWFIFQSLYKTDSVKPGKKTKKQKQIETNWLSTAKQYYNCYFRNI